MTDDTALKPSMGKLAPTAGELETLNYVLERTRATFSWKCGGLDADALRKPHPPSTMTLGGLVKHLALVEDDYAAGLRGVPIGSPWNEVDFEADPDWEWRTAFGLLAPWRSTSSVWTSRPSTPATGATTSTCDVSSSTFMRNTRVTPATPT